MIVHTLSIFKFYAVCRLSTSRFVFVFGETRFPSHAVEILSEDTTHEFLQLLCEAHERDTQRAPS